MFFHDADTAAAFLYLYDRPAFLQADPPRLYEGRYRFRLPPELWVSSQGLRSKAFCLWDPVETEQERRARWLEIARQMKAGGQTIYLNFYDPNPQPKLEQFLAVTGLKPG